MVIIYEQAPCCPQPVSVQQQSYITAEFMTDNNNGVLTTFYRVTVRNEAGETIRLRNFDQTMLNLYAPTGIVGPLIPSGGGGGDCVCNWDTLEW
jgi:hypothetical protein